MSVHTRESRVGGLAVVALDGVVDLATIATVRDALLATVQRHAGELVAVDLDGVTALDDTGLGVLLGVAATARDGGGDLLLVCSDPSRRDRLRRTRLDQAIEVRAAITP